MKKYDRLPIDCDFCVETFRAAMMANPPFYLHVHPLLVEYAKEVLADPGASWPGKRDAPIHIVPDDKLNHNEWYIVSSIGSDPP